MNVTNVMCKLSSTLITRGWFEVPILKRRNHAPMDVLWVNPDDDLSHDENIKIWGLNVNELTAYGIWVCGRMCV